MTLPRELKLIEGKLHQIPVEEMKSYRINHVYYNEVVVEERLSLEKIEGQSVELELVMDSLESNKFGLKVLKDKENEIVLYYDKKVEKFIFDCSKNGEEILGLEKHEEKSN